MKKQLPRKAGDSMEYLIFGAGFMLGAIVGGWIAYALIKRYREALGLPKDPFEPNIQYFL